MRRLFLLHALALIAILSAYAKHVSPEEAMTRAAAEKSIVGMRAPALASMTCVETLQTSAKVDAVYIFKGNGGEMFLPADDRINAVLGYVDSEAEGEMPEQLQWWLGEYVREIEYLQSQPEISAGQYVLVGAKNSSAQRASLSPISPKLTTIWNQTTPFNNLCPLVNGERSVTGCVATAGAQIMKYFEYPSSSMSGTITYNDSGTTRSLSLSGKTFDWSNMRNSYNGSYTTTQANAVAFLMEACGYAAEMNYSPEGSGAQDINLLTGLKNYFGYNNDAQCLDRSNYTYDQWEDIIYRHIQTVGPIYMSGDDGTGTSGHAFVCDGYSSNGYFHFNWGWGGYHDGYFLLTALNPEDQGTGGNTGGFNYHQQILANLTKPGGATIELPELPPLKLCGSLTATAIGDKTLSITSDYAGSNYLFVYNRSDETIKVRFSIKLVNTATNAKQIIESLATDYYEFPQNYGCSSIPFTYNNITPGEYRLYVVAQLYDDDEWFDPLCSEGCTNYVNLVINSKGNIESVITPVEGSVEAKDLQATSDVYWGKEFSYSFTAFNSGSTEASDVLFPAFCVLDSNNTLSIIAYGNDISVTLAAGETKDYSLSSTMTLNTDTDYSGETVYFCLVNSDYRPLDYTSVTIGEDQPRDPGSVEAKDLQATSDVYWGQEFSYSFTAFNSGSTEASDVLFPAFCVPNSDNTLSIIAYGNDISVTLAAGETKDYSLSSTMTLNTDTDYSGETVYFCLVNSDFSILDYTSVTIGEDQPQDPGSVEAQDLQATSDVYWGQEFSYSFTAFNSGSTEASDVLFPAFCVLNSDNTLSIIAYGNDISVTLAAGETKDYSLSSTMTLNTDTDYSGETVYFCLANSDYRLLDYTRVTIGEDQPRDPGSVGAKDLQATSDVYWGQEFSYSFTAFNSGSTEASDVLFPAFCVLDSDNTLSIIAYGNDISVTLAAGETKDYSLSSTMTLNTDTDYSGETVYFCLANSDYRLLDYTRVTILSADQTAIEATAFSYDGDADNVNKTDMTFNCGVKCTNGKFSDRLYVGIFDADMTKLLTYFGTDETMIISAGSTRNFQITGSYEDASEGDDYYAALGYFSDNQFQILATQAITICEEQSGIAKVADNSNAVTVKADRDADRLTISASTAISSVNVYSLDGRNRRLNIKLGTTEVSTSMAKLPAGVNIVKVTLSDGSSTITKIVK